MADMDTVLRSNSVIVEAIAKPGSGSRSGSRFEKGFGEFPLGVE